MIKKISPSALISLKEALAVIYWKKSDLRIFLEQSFSNIEKGKHFCSSVDFSKTKYSISDEVVTRLSKRPDLFNEDLLNILYNVCNMTDFSHLLKWDDGNEKAKIAKEKVKILQKQCQGYFAQQKEKELAEKRKQDYNNTISMVNESKKLKEELKQEFAEVMSSKGQKRGYAFEKFLNHIFNHYDLAARSSFKINGEQIDGAFSHNSSDYLLEAKWQDELISRSDLYSLDGKINTKLKNTIGLYISFNGFSQDILTNYTTNAIILMDGQDLYQILEDRISLPDMIEIKRKEAATTGKAMYRIKC